MNRSSLRPNPQRRLGVRVAEELERLEDADPYLYDVLTKHLERLRNENARHRLRAQQLQAELDELRAAYAGDVQTADQERGAA